MDTGRKARAGNGGSPWSRNIYAQYSLAARTVLLGLRGEHTFGYGRAFRNADPGISRQQGVRKSDLPHFRCRLEGENLTYSIP
jgi:hypothetical protein